MKKILVLVVVLMCFTSLGVVCYAAPYSEQTDDTYKYYITYYEGTDNRYALITDFFKADDTNLTELTIPSHVSTSAGQVPIVGIQFVSDSWGDNITKITLPDTFTTVANDFSTATNLTEIVIPNTVTTIERGAFSNYTNLSILNIPDSVTSIGDKVFDGCTSLESIGVDVNNLYYKSVDGVLFNNIGTTLVRYPEGKTDTSYSISNTVTSIQSGAFENCDNLESITIGNGVTQIGNSAFAYCAKLDNVTIPTNVTNLGSNVFYSSGSLRKLTIPTKEDITIGTRLITTNYNGLAVVYCYQDSYIKDYVMDDYYTELNSSWHRLPEVVNEMPNQNGEKDKPFSYTISDDTFNLYTSYGGYDYTYEVTGLPSGITFNYDTTQTVSGNPTFSGTPTVAGNFDITVTMTESNNSVSDTFTLSITETNTNPAVANEIPDQTATIGQEFSYTVPSNTFKNVSGFTYSATGMPNGITFNSNIKKFLGTPTVSDVYPVTLTATSADGNNSISDTFNITVNANEEGNTPPTVANEIPNGEAVVGETFVYSIPENTFVDAENDDLSLSMSTTSTAIYVSSSREIRYTPSAEETVSITITATDTKGKSVSDTFEIVSTKLPEFTTISVSNITKNSVDVTFVVDEDCEYTIAVMAPIESGNYNGPFWLLSQGKITGVCTSGEEVHQTVTHVLSNELEELMAGVDYALCVRVKDSDNNYVIGDIEFTTLKSINTTIPEAPQLENKTHYSITLTSMQGYEYSKDNGQNWQDEATFSGLSANTNYIFTQRIKETDTTYASSTNGQLEVKTNSRPSSGRSGGSSTPSVSGSKTITSSNKGKDVIFTIKDEDVKIKFNGLAFTEFKNDKVQVKFEKIDKNQLDISDDLKQKIGDLPILDIAIYINGEKEHFVSDEPIVIEIPVATDKENHKIVAVYIGEDRNLQIMEGVLNNGVMRFTTNHLSDYALMYVDKSFDDITSHWGNEAIEALAVREVVNGIGNDLFNPEDEITRAEFVTIMVRYFNLTSNNKSNYSDVEDGKWYTKFIAIAKANDILPEKYGDTFEPSKPITREEMMYILYKSLEQVNRLDTLDDKGDKLSDFTDSDMVSDYAIEGSEYLISRDIINGSGDGIFNPTSTSTRAEVAQMLWNMINLSK